MRDLPLRLRITNARGGAGTYFKRHDGETIWDAPLMEALLSSSDVFGLLRLLFSEIEHTDLSPAPNPLSVRILPLVVDRLDLFHMLFWIGQHPRVLADMLLFPPTAALACMLIARWQPPHDAWNRDLTQRDHQLARASAFADAVSVMGHSLKQSTVRPMKSRRYWRGCTPTKPHAFRVARGVSRR
jgi:hypothetical protein